MKVDIKRTENGFLLDYNPWSTIDNKVYVYKTWEECLEHLKQNPLKKRQ